MKKLIICNCTRKGRTNVKRDLGCIKNGRWKKNISKRTLGESYEQNVQPLVHSIIPFYKLRQFLLYLRFAENLCFNYFQKSIYHRIMTLLAHLPSTDIKIHIYNI